MSGVKGRSGRKGSYAKQMSKALGIIDSQLPELIEKLIEKARNGDREALIYLVDRRLGKPRQDATLEIEGGENLTAGLVAQLFEQIARKRRELEEQKPVVEIEQAGGER